MKASVLLLTILGVIAVKLVTGKIDHDTEGNVVSDKQQPAIAGTIAVRRKRGSGIRLTCRSRWMLFKSCNGDCTWKRDRCVESELDEKMVFTDDVGLDDDVDEERLLFEMLKNRANRLKKKNVWNWWVIMLAFAAYMDFSPDNKFL